MLERISGDDWMQVFGAAGEQAPADGWQTIYNPGTPSAVAGDNTVSTATFTREDVKAILAVADGENDGPSWIGVFRLRDGRFAFCEGGCDYTGWDCRSSASAVVSDSLARLIRFALSDDDRSRLGCGEGQFGATVLLAAA